MKKKISLIGAGQIGGTLAHLITIKELAETIKALVGYEGEITWDTSRPNGQPRRCLDTVKAKEQFGFEAKTSLEEGLKKTYNWYVNEHTPVTPN